MVFQDIRNIVFFLYFLIKGEGGLPGLNGNPGLDGFPGAKGKAQVNIQTQKKHPLCGVDSMMKVNCFMVWIQR